MLCRRPRATVASHFRLISRCSRSFYSRGLYHALPTAVNARALDGLVPPTSPAKNLRSISSESLAAVGKIKSEDIPVIPGDGVTSNIASTAGESELEMPQSESESSSATQLKFENGPLVWVDLEMTGLDPKVDKIMEVAVLITNGDLQLVDEGVEFIIHVDKESLDRMDEWCTSQHGSSGLTVSCLKSTNTLASVSKAVLEYVQARIPDKKVGVLAGNSVHVDKQFLATYMPELVEHLHYRIVDVSSIKELCRRWYPGVEAPKPSSNRVAHRALEDIKGSIRELQWYRENLFVGRVAV